MKFCVFLWQIASSTIKWGATVNATKFEDLVFMLFSLGNGPNVTFRYADLLSLSANLDIIKVTARRGSH